MAHLHTSISLSYRRVAQLIPVVLTAAALSACGSSTTTTITSPATVSKCGVAVTGPETAVPASGGTGAIAVTTARECAWTASSENPWLTIKAGGSGQGD